MEFSDSEFAVLDLSSEDAEPLGHLVHLDSDTPRLDEAVSVLSALVQRGLLALYARREDDEPLTTNDALRALSDLGSFIDDGTGDWWRYHAMTTALGNDAYRRAYNERN